MISASKGLGKAIVLGLAREGANVAICALSKESLMRNFLALSEHDSPV